MEHIWEWFVELSNARQGNGFGGYPLSYSEMLAWAQLTGRSPTHYDIRIIKLLDALALKQKGK